MPCSVKDRAPQGKEIDKKIGNVVKSTEVQKLFLKNKKAKIINISFSQK